MVGAMQIPRTVARFNKRINNPIQRQYAWLLPPWSVIVHRGRRSGRLYRTPVNAFRRGDTIAVAILYGERSDWVQNVLAGESQIVRAGRTYALSNPRIVAGDAPGESISRAGRAAGRLAGKLLLAEMAGPLGRFGRGPR
jgi:deazaflavin-dependent oxidoreductase (nitroreductase family)